jgi:hypothetical protein
MIKWLRKMLTPTPIPKRQPGTLPTFNEWLAENPCGDSFVLMVRRRWLSAKAWALLPGPDEYGDMPYQARSMVYADRREMLAAIRKALLAAGEIQG